MSTSIAGTRRLDALDREPALIKRRGLVAGGILDRQTGDAGLDASDYIRVHAPRLVGESPFEIGVERQIDRGVQRGKMIADLVDGDAVVGLADRPREGPHWSRRAP